MRGTRAVWWSGCLLAAVALGGCATSATPRADEASTPNHVGVSVPVVAKPLQGVGATYRGAAYDVRLERVLQRPADAGKMLHVLYTVTNRGQYPLSTCDLELEVSDELRLEGQPTAAATPTGECGEVAPGASVRLEGDVNPPSADEDLTIGLFTAGAADRYVSLAHFTVPAAEISPLPQTIEPVSVQGRLVTITYIGPAPGSGTDTQIDYTVKNLSRDTIYLCHGFWPVLTDAPLEDGQLSVWGYQPKDNTCSSFAPDEVGEYSLTIPGQIPAEGLELSIQSPPADAGIIKEWGKIKVLPEHVAGYQAPADQ
ncbi:hypothetical protein [Buchananella hordeovulneris]|uniref:hypothetical protein n=1 Tax=Buchananella hordeovulneris TaxID=52770 RepID=UPI0026DB8B82|nr:hypothetical protein [Buchananella hordeovulneris]MDO5081118.1 hypothetical protein [Buchananella hordeovulneris]